MQLRVYVGFVTKCFGTNISMGMCVVGCGFPGVYIFFVGGFCSGALSNRVRMFNMCNNYVSGPLVAGAPRVGGFVFTLMCVTGMDVFCYIVVGIYIPHVGKGQWSVVRGG